MAAGEIYQNILEHLKKDGPLNTFRLATTLGLNRFRLLSFIEKLEKAGAVEVQHGVVKFVAEKLAEVKKTIPKSKRTVKRKPAASGVQAEFLGGLKEKILKLETKLKELEQKPFPAPKIIKKTIIKTVPASAPLPKKKKKARKKTKMNSGKKVKKKVFWKKLKIKKFKFPKIKVTEYIRKLKKPKFLQGGGK